MARSCLRKAFRRSPKCYEVMQSQLSKMLGPRGGARFTCMLCKKQFEYKNIDVDHIDPVIPLHLSEEELSLDEFCERLDCPIENLRGLCIECHRIETNIQNKERGRLRREKKFVFDGDMWYIIEGGELRHGYGLDKIRDEEIKFIEKSYKTASGANKYLLKMFPDK